MYKLCNMPLSVHEFDKLTIWVLSFQQIFRFVYRYRCYEVICIKGYYIGAKKVLHLKKESTKSYLKQTI